MSLQLESTTEYGGMKCKNMDSSVVPKPPMMDYSMEKCESSKKVEGKNKKSLSESSEPVQDEPPVKQRRVYKKKVSITPVIETKTLSPFTRSLTR